MSFCSKVVTRVFQSILRNQLTLRSSSNLIKSAYLNVTKSNHFAYYNTVCSKKRSFLLSQVRAMGGLSELDPSSFTRPELSIVKHISLSLNVDFEKKILNGTAILNIDVLQEINDVILDVSNLSIESIEAGDGKPLNYTIGNEVPTFGSKLTINLPKPATSDEKTHHLYQIKCKNSIENTLSTKSQEETDDVYVKLNNSSEMKLTYTGFMYEPLKESLDKNVETQQCGYCVCKVNENKALVGELAKIKLKIKYSTSPNASALQWLDPAQTSGKKLPYLFSQCQPIHARSILPCQDTPYVKFTYDAEVTAPSEFTVLMSALRGDVKGNVTTFHQPMPLPAYLVAIAVGSLESRTLGPRSKVWSEKEEVERAAWEFSETEKYLSAAERLCGAYVWRQYDLLVLPPSFPYGGMENPCLTFVTPTLLAGDRSLADVIVHEIMHSWTGNLVTNRNFEHFWLNEGFTVFLERKVAASLIADSEEAKRSRDFHSILGLQELRETVVDHLGEDNPLTRLVVTLTGPTHPDDAFSRVPYEKGSLFLRYLEDLVGGPEVFDGFLRSYLNHFAQKSLDTDQFKTYLLDYFKDNEQLRIVDWNTWLNHSGMPPIIPDYDTSMTKAVSTLVEKISANGSVSPDDIGAFTPHQMIYFLQALVENSSPLSIEMLRAVGEAYGLENSKNAEIQYRWLRLCVRSNDTTKLADVFNFVNSQGRMKYVRPVYRDLYAWEAVRQQAIDNFLANEQYMMHVSAYTLRKDLRLAV